MSKARLTHNPPTHYAPRNRYPLRLGLERLGARLPGTLVQLRGPHCTAEVVGKPKAVLAQLRELIATLLHLFVVVRTFFRHHYVLFVRDPLLPRRRYRTGIRALKARSSGSLR